MIPRKESTPLDFLLINLSTDRKVHLRTTKFRRVENNPRDRQMELSKLVYYLNEKKNEI